MYKRQPWKRLAQSGHGLWVEPPPSPGAPLGEGEEGTGVFALQAGLTRLGYDCAPTGKYDSHTTTIVSAFQKAAPACQARRSSATRRKMRPSSSTT